MRRGRRSCGRRRLLSRRGFCGRRRGSRVRGGLRRSCGRGRLRRGRSFCRSAQRICGSGHLRGPRGDRGRGDLGDYARYRRWTRDADCGGRRRLLERRHAREDLVGEREVVGAEVGTVVEDRDCSLGRLGVRDRRAHDGVEDLLAEAFTQRRERLAAVDGAHVGDVEQHAEEREVGIEAVARELDDLDRLLDALQREVLRLRCDQRAVRRHERIHRQKPQ